MLKYQQVQEQIGGDVVERSSDDGAAADAPSAEETMIHEPGVTGEHGGEIDRWGAFPELAVGGEPRWFYPEAGGGGKVILVSARFKKGEELPRLVVLRLRVRSAGAQPFDTSSLQDHFEADDGRVYDGTSYLCETDDLPIVLLRKGQYAEGCLSYDLPNDAGRLVLQEGPDLGGFSIKIPAA